MPTPMQPEKLVHTVKEMALEIERSESYVMDMKRAGFKLPATRSQAIEFIHAHGPPGRFRQVPVTRFEVYSRSNPKKNGKN